MIRTGQLKLSKQDVDSGSDEEVDDLVPLSMDKSPFKRQLIKNLEIWLQSTLNDKLKLNKSDFIQSFLKENENLELYFQFIIDPY